MTKSPASYPLHVVLQDAKLTALVQKCGTGKGREILKNAEGKMQNRQKKNFWIPILRLDFWGWRGNGKTEMHAEHI